MRTILRAALARQALTLVGGCVVVWMGVLVLMGCQSSANRDTLRQVGEVRRVLLDRGGSEEERWEAYQRLGKLPAREDMNSWVRMVNDHSLEPDQRLLAFHAFWGRAAPPGTTLQQLARRYAIASWFTPETLKDEGGASQLPAVIHRYRRPGWDRHGFLSADLPGERPQLNAAPVYLALSRSVGLEEVMDCVRRPEATEEVRILAVWVFGRDDEDSPGDP